MPTFLEIKGKTFHFQRFVLKIKKTFRFKETYVIRIHEFFLLKKAELFLVFRKGKP